MSRRRKDAFVGLVRKISTQSPATVFSTSPLRKPPRVHAPCIGRVTGAGRSPGSRVAAFAPPSRENPVALRRKARRLQLRGQLRDRHAATCGQISPDSLLAASNRETAHLRQVPSEQVAAGLVNRLPRDGGSLLPKYQGRIVSLHRDIPQQRHVVVAVAALHDVAAGWKRKM